MRKYIVLFLFLALNVPIFAQNWLWGKQGTGAHFVNSYGTPVATDKNGNAYTAGDFIYTLKFGSYTLMDTTDEVYLAKYDSNGILQWVTQSFGSMYNDSYCSSVITDNKSRALLTGFYFDSLIFSQDTLSSGFGTAGLYIAKFDNTGNILWLKGSKAISVLGGCFGASLVTDASGNIYCTGHFIDTVILGDDTLKSFRNNNAFVAKFDSSGNLIWAKQANVPTVTSSGYSQSIGLDSNTNIYVTGSFTDTINIGAFTLIGKNTTNTFIAKYDSSGNVVWAQASSLPSSSSNAFSRAIVVDRGGNSYISGFFSDTISFDSDTLYCPLPPLPITELFFVKYNSSGKVIWAKQTIDSGSICAPTLAIDGVNNIYLSFTEAGRNSQFGNQVLNTFWDVSYYLAKIDTLGNIQCYTTLSADDDFYYSFGNNADNIAVDYTGNYVYRGGSISSLAIPIITGADTLDAANLTISTFVARWQPCVTTGISTLTKQPIISIIFPNPSNGQFTIQQSGISNRSTLEVYNMLGQKIYSVNLSTQKKQLDLSNSPSGVYMYRIFSQTDNLSSHGRFIIQK